MSMGGFCCRATLGSALAPKLSNAALTTGLAVLLQLPVNTFTVYGIALQNVGDDLALVDALPPNLKGDLVTNARQLDSFMDGLEERTREIRRRCLMHYDSLYQYNSVHDTSPEESWFIFIIWEPAIEASRKNRLKNLVTSTACHRAGIHFFVVDHASVQGKYEDWGSLAMLQFDSLDQRHESLEYLTPWPFGVAGRRPLEIGKSRFFAPLLTKDRHLQIAGRLG